MILSRVNNYLRQHRRASVTAMAHGLGASPDALKRLAHRRISPQPWRGGSL